MALPAKVRSAQILDSSCFAADLYKYRPWQEASLRLAGSLNDQLRRSRHSSGTDMTLEKKRKPRIGTCCRGNTGGVVLTTPHLQGSTLVVLAKRSQSLTLLVYGMLRKDSTPDEAIPM